MLVATIVGLRAGWGLGILVYLVTRSVLPASSAIWLAVAATVGGVVLLVAGLVAEHLCTLPPPEDDEGQPEESHA